MNDDPFTAGLPPPDGHKGQASPLAIFAMIGGLLFAALSFIVFGIGYALGAWGSDEIDGTNEVVAAQSAEPSAEAAPAETGEPTPRLLGAEATPTLEAEAPAAKLDHADGPLPGAEPVPEYVPKGASSAGGGGSTSAGAGEGSTTAGGAAGEGSTTAKSPRVSVTLVLKHYDRVDVKLGGKVFRLEADKTVKLRPGGYRVELRKSPDAPWKPAGLIEVGLGNEYRVTLLDPPLVKLETI